MTAFAELLPHSSIKWTASPKRNEEWPVKTTHGLRIAVLKPSAKNTQNQWLQQLLMFLNTLSSWNKTENLLLKQPQDYSQNAISHAAVQ